MPGSTWMSYRPCVILSNIILLDITGDDERVSTMPGSMLYCPCVILSNIILFDITGDDERVSTMPGSTCM